jgi:hypothetical protein
MRVCLLFGLTFVISLTIAADFEIDLPKIRAERDAAKARKDAAEAVIRTPNVEDAALKQAIQDRVKFCREVTRLTGIIRKAELDAEGAARKKINDRKLCDEHAGKSIRFYDRLGLKKNERVPDRETLAKLSDEDLGEWADKICSYQRHFSGDP